VVREVWRQRHGHRAAPLLLEVTYLAGQRSRAVLCGPAGDDTLVVDLDYDLAERMAAALGEPDRHSAIRFLSEALSLLGRLRVAPPGSMAGYFRDEFPHWASDAASYGWSEPDGFCDVRDTAIIRDGQGVRVDEECEVTAGTWYYPYTGQTLTDSSGVDIDHVVPLANAWRSGPAARPRGARRTARRTPTSPRFS
jgi:hypothetical protein